MPGLIASVLGFAIAVPSAARVDEGGLSWLPGAQARSALTGQRIVPSAIAGFAYVDSDGTIQTGAYNSAGGPVSANHIGGGQYDVVFGNLGFRGGDVQITSLTGRECTVASWFQSGADLHVTVSCYKGSLQTDAGFAILVTRPRRNPNGVFDYDWVDKPRGKLTGSYQYNSSRKVNSVRHPAPGEYVVSMPGPGLAGANLGTVKVSPYGFGSGSCQVAGWQTTRAGQLITVRCFDAAGAPQDRNFNIVYTRGTNLMGQNGEITANGSADRGNVLYRPKVQFDSRRGARIVIIHLDTGYYEALFIGSPISSNPNGGSGNLQVTPVSNKPRFCSVQPVQTHTPAAFISCSDLSAPADTAFTIQWVVN